MPTLVRAFVDYDLDLLHIIAAQWDIDLESSDRAAAAEELAVAMLQSEAASATWAHLSSEEQQALTDLLAHDGRLSFTHFVRVYGDLRPMGPARRERERPWLNPVSVTESLFYRGLVVRVFEQTISGAQEHIAIPSDLIPLLPRPDPSTVASIPGYAVAPPRKLKDGHLTAPDDMATLLSYLLLRDANAREWLVNAPLEMIDQHLRRPDEPAYRALLIQLAYDLGMIADEKTLTHVVTRVNREIARPWLEAPRLHQARSLAETWLASSSWNDLAYTPGLEADQWPGTPVLARQAILQMLASVPTEIWWSLDGFVEHVKNTNPDFQRPGGDYDVWYIHDAYTGEILHGFQYWDYIEGALLRFVIEKQMKWLGLTRAGYGAFYLTRLGLALQGRAEWPSSPDPDARIRVDEQGVISVPVHVGRYERLQIARFSAWISAPLPAPYTTAAASRDDGVYVYRLTPQAIQRVESDSILLGQHIIPFLQRLSGHSIPSNVAKMLQGWQDTPREVIVHDVVIVTARDLGVYERLRGNESINRWLGQQIGPHAHVVKREHMPKVLNALRQMGILPLFEGHDKDNRPE
jgi:hypothetical protein